MDDKILAGALVFVVFMFIAGAVSGIGDWFMIRQRRRAERDSDDEIDSFLRSSNQRSD